MGNYPEQLSALLSCYKTVLLNGVLLKKTTLLWTREESISFFLLFLERFYRQGRNATNQSSA